MAMAEEFFGSCQRGDLEAVQAALESGVDVNIQDRTRDRRTGLMWALLANKPEVAIFLLEQPGININHTTDSGITALHQAARSEENIEVLALLLKSKLELLKNFSPLCVFFFFHPEPLHAQVYVYVSHSDM